MANLVLTGGNGYPASEQFAFIYDKNVIKFTIDTGVLKYMIIDNNYRFDANINGEIYIDVNLILREKYKNQYKYTRSDGGKNYAPYSATIIKAIILPVLFYDNAGNEFSDNLIFDRLLLGARDYGVYSDNITKVDENKLWISNFRFNKFELLNVFKNTIDVHTGELFGILTTADNGDEIKKISINHTIYGNQSNYVVNLNGRKSIEILLWYMYKNNDFETYRVNRIDYLDAGDNVLWTAYPKLNIPRNIAGRNVSTNKFLFWQGRYGETKLIRVNIKNKKIISKNRKYIDVSNYNFADDIYDVKNVIDTKFVDVKQNITLTFEFCTVEKAIQYMFDLLQSPKIWLQDGYYVFKVKVLNTDLIMIDKRTFQISVEYQNKNVEYE